MIDQAQICEALKHSLEKAADLSGKLTMKTIHVHHELDIDFLTELIRQAKKIKELDKPRR